MATSDKPTYYVDSGVFIDLISGDGSTDPSKTAVELLSAADEGQCRLITSTVTIIEVLKGAEERRMNVYDSDVQTRIDNLWHPGSSPVELHEAHELVMREATTTYRRLFRDHNWGRAKGLDMVHLVTARREGAQEFFTTETGLQNYEEEFGLIICHPHLPPSPNTEEDDANPQLFGIPSVDATNPEE